MGCFLIKSIKCYGTKQASLWFWCSTIERASTCCFLPSGLHRGNRFPNISSRVEPLRRCQTHRAVISTDTIKKVIDSGNPARRSATRHRWHRHPSTHSRVKTFYRALVVGRVESAQSVNAIVWKNVQVIKAGFGWVSGSSGGKYRRVRVPTQNSTAKWLEIGWVLGWVEDSFWGFLKSNLYIGRVLNYPRTYLVLIKENLFWTFLPQHSTEE